MQLETRNRIGRLLAPVLLLGVVSLIPVAGPLVRGEVFLFRDHFDYFFPLRSFTAASIRGGELPLWNPFNGSGERWLANPQTGVFYPPSWIFLVLPLNTAYVLYLWMHLFVLGVGAFILFRRWASPQAALVSAAALMLCGPTLSLLDVSNNLGSFAWMPLVIFAALRRGDGDSRSPLSADALLLTLMFLAGEPFLAGLGAVLYAIIVATARQFRALILVAILAALLSGAQLLPFLEMLKGSDRLTGAVAPREAMAPGDWLASLVPPADPASGALQLSQSFIASIYLGLPIVFAAVAAAAAARRLESRRQKAVTGWMAIFLGAVIAAAGTIFPLLGRVWSSLPIDLNRYPSRLVCLGILAATALSAIGLDVLAEKSKRWRATALVLALIASVAALLLFSGSPLGAWRVSVLVFWLMTLGAILLVRPQLAAAPVLLLPFLTFDYMAASRTLLRSGPPPTRIEPYAQLLDAPYKLSRLISPSDRIQSEADRRRWLSGYLNLVTGCFDAWTPAPVVSAHYLRVYDVAVAEPRPDIVDFMTIGYLLTARPVVHPAFLTRAKLGDLTLLENRNLRPVAQLWSDYRTEPDPINAAESLIAGGYDADRMVVVSCRRGEECLVPPVTPRRPGTTTVVASFPGLNQLSVRVVLPHSSIMTVSQLDAPGWKVEIDGVEAQPLVANGLFRAVSVPEGQHRVSWHYRPHSLTIGIGMSTIALVVMMGDVLAFCRRRRRELIFLRSLCSFS